ncbi:MAG: helix-turn-helix domain-containing protein [Pseudomonadota bacterium]
MPESSDREPPADRSGGPEDRAPLPPTAGSLGGDLRALRAARGLTLGDMAKALGRSVGWVSQVERDISTPRMSDIEAMARVLGVSRSILFGAAAPRPGEAGRIVRADARRVVGERARGLVESLLSPDLTDDFEVIHSTFQPGARRSGPIERPTQEVAYIVEGKLDIWLGEDRFTVARGDSFRVRGEQLAWANPYDEPAVAIWVIAPPVY